ncbi:transposase, fragment [Aromatoleum aromaticum EbN1]|uniref:Transposase n=1 Tax=Aromatoleum aromaticum (strain DSM 19018 / LMG 30748 / EbN1) TaxID=76114 RepID=Q5NY81_AROAE|nr:transposase, fragment [Aromatoleum aromaticum EbN1]
MERMPRGVYPQEFREQAVELAQTEGLSMREAARRLSMPLGSRKNWVNAARAGKLASTASSDSARSSDCAASKSASSRRRRIRSTIYRRRGTSSIANLTASARNSGVCC